MLCAEILRFHGRHVLSEARQRRVFCTYSWPATNRTARWRVSSQAASRHQGKGNCSRHRALTTRRSQRAAVLTLLRLQVQLHPGEQLHDGSTVSNMRLRRVRSVWTGGRRTTTTGGTRVAQHIHELMGSAETAKQSRQHIDHAHRENPGSPPGSSGPSSAR